MKSLVVLPSSLLAALVLIATPVAAQSLADVARSEDARRGAVRATSKTYTNADLRPDPTTPQPDPAAATPAVPGDANAPAATEGQAAAGAPPEPVEEKLDEKFWRSRAASIRARIQKAQQGVESLSGATHQDPREQAKVETLLKRAQGILERAESAQREFEVSAAAAKVPKDWIQ